MDGPSLEALSIQQALSSLRSATHLPPVDSLIIVINKCRAFKNLPFARSLHAHLHHNGLDLHPSVGNFLVPMLVECGGLSHALQAFCRLPHRREHAWTSLIQGFVNCGNSPFALSLFENMQEDLVHPSPFTLQALLKACAQLKCLAKGLEVHTQIFMAGFDVDPFVGNTLIDMYAKCGSFSEACEVFYMLPRRDVVSWNALMSGCTEYMLCEETLWFSEKMRLVGLGPNVVTFLCMLKACGSLQALDRGQEVHTDIVVEGLESDAFIGNALVYMYAKCDSPIESLEVFCDLDNRGVESWNTLITAYSEQGLDEEALNCLEEMQLEGVCSNEVTYLCSLKVCGDAGLLEQGRKLHIDALKGGFERNLFLGNTLVDMYAKCGSLDEAYKVFDGLLERDLVAWNALLAGYARRGEGDILLSLIQVMMYEGVQPNWVTFLNVLSVCNHNGVVHNGQDFFEIMISSGIIPTARHHSCIIDLFGRCGQLDEGLAVMEVLFPHVNAAVWQARYNKYQSRGELETGIYAFPWSVKEEEGLVGNYGDDHLLSAQEKEFHLDAWG